MEPYKPPRSKNPGVPPGAPIPNPGMPTPNPRVNPDGEEIESWITKHPVLFLGFSAIVTAGLGVFVTHYVGGYLRKREERARIAGELAEAEVLGEEPVMVPNPELEPPTTEERLESLEGRLINMSRHFGVQE